MNVTEIVTLMGSVGSLIGIIGGIIIQLRGQNEARNVVGVLNDKLDINHKTMAQVVAATDGMKDALIESTAAKSHQDGVAEGKAAEQANPTSVSVPLTKMEIDAAKPTGTKK